jgi:nucleotide-binding universal stress UspA family protein
MDVRFKDRFRKICFVRTGGAGDAGAFERAIRLSECTEAELSIVSVVENPPDALIRMLASLGAALETVTGELEASAEIERMVEAARQRNVQASGEVLRGSAFLEITRKVLRDPPDLLIKAAQPLHVIQRVVFGHTDRQLIRKCPCPVWIEKPSSGRSHDRILAAIDPVPFQNDFDFDPVREELNTRILAFARVLAEAEEAELHVVHVWSFDLESSLRTRVGIEDEEVAEIGESIREKHNAALKQLVAPHLQHIQCVHLLKGHAGEQIARLAADEHPDAIVMGTMCRGGVEGLLIGNTAETVLDHVDCSIMTLKPRGFVSPVHL